MFLPWPQSIMLTSHSAKQQQQQEGQTQQQTQQQQRQQQRQQQQQQQQPPPPPPPVKSPAPTPVPSGIAQLRKSIDVSIDQSVDPMNLDDFIVPNSVASPAGITSPATSDAGGLPSSMAHSHGIPIATRGKPQVQIPRTLPPSSVPQSSITVHRSSEFDYVQKRVRKTSIDERRGVSCPWRDAGTP